MCCVLCVVWCAHSVVAWLGRLGVQQSELWLVIAHPLLEIVKAEHQTNTKTVFYALLTIASMGYGSASARASIKVRLSDCRLSCQLLCLLADTPGWERILVSGRICGASECCGSGRSDEPERAAAASV